MVCTLEVFLRRNIRLMSFNRKKMSSDRRVLLLIPRCLSKLDPNYSLIAFDHVLCGSQIMKWDEEVASETRINKRASAEQKSTVHMPDAKVESEGDVLGKSQLRLNFDEGNRVFEKLIWLPGDNLFYDFSPLLVPSD